MIIAFLGYSKPDTRFNGVATVILQQTQWLEEHGHSVLHYHLFNKEEYRNLIDFLIKNKVDIAVWHMTSFSRCLTRKLPCPLICLFHSDPNIINPNYINHFIKKFNTKITASNKLFAKTLSYLHYIYRQLFFVYVTMLANKMVLLSPNYIPGFLASKIFTQKVTAIANATDMPFLQECRDKDKNVVFVGRLLNEHKGVDILLRIWKRVEDKFPDWKLIICGDGPDRDELYNDVLRLQLKRVDFQGFVTANVVEKILGQSSIFCMTSRLEGFGLVLVEAARLGCVPIAFDSYLAAKDIIDHGVNGILIKPFDEDKYADELMELMGNKNKLSKMAKAGIEKSKDYTVDKIMMQWIRLYDEILKSSTLKK